MAWSATRALEDRVQDCEEDSAHDGNRNVVLAQEADARDHEAAREEDCDRYSECLCTVEADRHRVGDSTTTELFRRPRHAHAHAALAT